MRVVSLGEGVYEISLAWSNAYLLVQNGDAALIDTGLQADNAALRQALAQVGVAEERVRAIYLTHAHCDHAGSAAYFKRRGATVYAHQVEAKFLGTPRRTYAPLGWKRWTRLHTTLLFALGEIRYPVERCGVDVPLGDGETLDAPGGPLRVVACPGHTSGHVAYFRERDGLLFSGDAILNIVPIKRVSGLSLAIRALSDDWEQCKVSARHLAALRPAALLAGHGWPLKENTAARLEKWAKTL